MQATVNADRPEFGGFVSFFLLSSSFFFLPETLLSPCFETPKEENKCLKDKTLSGLHIIFHKKKFSIKTTLYVYLKNTANQCAEMLKFPDQKVYMKGYCLRNIELIKSGNNTIIANLIYSIYIIRMLIR